QQLILRQLLRGGIGHVQDLATQRQDRLSLAITRLLGRAPRRATLDNEDFGALFGVQAAVGKLARQAQLARCALPPDLLFAPAPEAILGLVDAPLEKFGRLLRGVGEPVIKGIAHGVLDDARGFLRGKLVLGLPLKLRLADEY